MANILIDEPDGSLWKKGLRINSKVDWAGFSEQVIIHSDMTIQIPINVDFAIAAVLLIVFTTSMVALAESIFITSNDWILVHTAAGGVGFAAVEIAKALVAKVIATVSIKEEWATAGYHGANVGINYIDKDAVAQENDLTKDRGQTILLKQLGELLASKVCTVKRGMVIY